MFSNWKVCRQGISRRLFEDILKFDASAPRDSEVWRKVRKSYKGVIDHWALETELPDTCMGLLLFMMIKQVNLLTYTVASHIHELTGCQMHLGFTQCRRVSRRSMKKQDLERALQGKQEEISKAESDLSIKIEKVRKFTTVWYWKGNNCTLK